ncbi:MAG: type IV toxin-antitoxin system AbiEi family antitoxin [Thiotrichaceae bacterium]|nr:type IV toxin-antitoxin system AbiEi family antitoxin [Thiotrichaceae bacterium]
MASESQFATLVETNAPFIRISVFEHSSAHSIENFLDGEAHIRMNNGDEFKFAVVFKKLHRKESLDIFIQQKDSYCKDIKLPLLLICSPLTPFLAEYCENNKINYIDTVGNARIHIAGLHIMIEGKKPSHNLTYEGRRITGITEGIMKLLFVILSEPTMLLTKNYRQLAGLANISLGMVSKSFYYLTQRGFYRKTSTGGRLISVPELMKLWLKEYAFVIKPKLKGVMVICTEQWENIPMAEGDYWGGEVAAAKISNKLYPERLQLFTHQALQQRLAKLRMKPSKNGNLWLVSAFWGKGFELNEQAKVMLAIAELLASQDDRNIEVAEFLDEQYLRVEKTIITPN